MVSVIFGSDICGPRLKSLNFIVPSQVRSDVNPLQRFLRGVPAVRGRLLLRLRARLRQRSTRGRLPDQRRTLSLHSYLQNHASRPLQRTLHFRTER